MRTLIILQFLVFASFVASLSGQTTNQVPAYVRPPVPKQLGEFTISLRYTQAPSIRFGNLGNIDIKAPIIIDDLTVAPAGEDKPSGRVALFNDGFVIAGYDGIPSQPNTGDTTGYYTSLGDSNTTGVSNVDETKLLLHQYGTTGGANTFYEGDMSDNMGWEIGYTRFFSEKRTFGLEFGFSFNGFDSSYQNSLSRDLIYQEWVYETEGGEMVPNDFEPEEDSEGNITYKWVKVSNNAEDHVDRPKINIDSVTIGEPDVTNVPNAALVETVLDFRSAMYNFRLGSTYRFKFGDSFSMNIGAGLIIRYLDVTFSSEERLQIHDSSGTYKNIEGFGGLLEEIEGNWELYDEEKSGDVVNTATKRKESSWQVGAYVDASANYLFTERMSVFSGLEYQQGSTYSTTANKATADLDLNGLISIKTGFGIKF